MNFVCIWWLAEVYMITQHLSYISKFCAILKVLIQTFSPIIGHMIKLELFIFCHVTLNWCKTWKTFSSMANILKILYFFIVTFDSYISFCCTVEFQHLIRQKKTLNYLVETARRRNVHLYRWEQRRDYASLRLSGSYYKVGSLFRAIAALRPMMVYLS